MEYYRQTEQVLYFSYIAYKMWDGKTTYFIAVTDFQMAKMKGRKGCSKAFVAIISRGRDIKMMNEVMELSTSKVLSKGLQVVVCFFPIV